MSKHLTESLEKAYSLLEEDFEEFVPDEIEIEVEEIPEEIPETPEMEPETEDNLEVEERLSNLESEVEEVKNLLVAKDVAEVDDFEASTEELIDPEKQFSDKIFSDLLFYSKLPESCEITEELLDKPNFKIAYIPSVANRNRISAKEVRDILLGRASKGDDK